VKKISSKEAIKAVSIGLLAAVVFSALALLLPFSIVKKIFIGPGLVVGTLLGPLVPDSLTYSLVPEGGAPAAVLLFLLGAILFWTILAALLWIFLKAKLTMKH